MALYAGQGESSVTPLESESNKTIFDEATRREAYDVIAGRADLTHDLEAKLVAMYRDDSHQAQYFLGRFISEGILEYSPDQSI